MKKIQNSCSQKLNIKSWKRYSAQPTPKKSGEPPRADTRKMLKTILYILYSGCRWKDVPQSPEYAPSATAHRWLKRWQEEGVLQKLLRSLVIEAGEKGKIQWERLIVLFPSAPGGGEQVEHGYKGIRSYIASAVRRKRRAFIL